MAVCAAGAKCSLGYDWRGGYPKLAKELVIRGTMQCDPNCNAHPSLSSTPWTMIFTILELLRVTRRWQFASLC
jgi:hypothetical protein